MDTMTAEEFLRQVRTVAEANDINLDSIKFTTEIGMRCSWYNPGEDGYDITWAAETGKARN